MSGPGSGLLSAGVDGSIEWGKGANWGRVDAAVAGVDVLAFLIAEAKGFVTFTLDISPSSLSLWKWTDGMGGGRGRLGRATRGAVDGGERDDGGVAEAGTMNFRVRAIIMDSPSLSSGRRRSAFRHSPKTVIRMKRRPAMAYAATSPPTIPSEAPPTTSRHGCKKRERKMCFI